MGALVKWLPAGLHKALLPLAFRIRHRWRKWRGKPLVGCAAVLTDARGDLLLLRHSYGPDNWGLPGGGVDAKEDPEAAIRREMHEELGLELNEVEPVGALQEEVSGSPLTAHLFAASISETPKPDGREVIEARFFSPNALPQNIGTVTRARIAAWQEWSERKVSGG